MTERRGDRDEVKALLKLRIAELCKHLLPDGYRSGRYWMARNPTRHDRHAGSFWVVLSGTAAGAWKDSAGGDRDKGDVIGLIAYIHRTEFKEALGWARGWLGLADMPAALKRQQLLQAQARRETEEKRDAQKLLDERRKAKGVWLYCKHKTLLGTVAETYLTGRHIPLRVLPRQPGALRFSPEQWHPESRKAWPAIVAAMTGAGGDIVAIHRTFLALDGSGKAPIDPQRKIWPRFKGTGAAIHLWRGETGISHIDAHKQGLWDTLVITEGFEDGLSVAVACPEYRVWCAGTLGNIAELTLPECAGEVIVCADNDWGKPEAAQALERALTALARQGRPGQRIVKTARSLVGKDVNDALRAGAGWAES
jgi:hypothetical protein